jgi:DNA polymerase III alpha subunit
MTNSEYVASQCNVDLKLNDYKYPSFPQLKSESSVSMLSRVATEGLKKRYETIDEKVFRRLKYELQVIDELNFSDYFLIVWDIVQEAKKRGMITIGRGSAANSLVAYCLELTQVDPVRQNLYFERFLNKARSNPPDVDIDFSWKERDEIVKYVFEKYGYERVAMISTTITFRARSAFRETAKAFGISDREITKFSKKIPWTNASNLPKISEMFPESRDIGLDKEPWKSIVKLASRIANFPRHLSIHPSGIVITPTKITDYCALEYAKNKGLGLIITQPDMYSIEDLGLIKIDLLSQRSLGVLRDTMQVLDKKYQGD